MTALKYWDGTAWQTISAVQGPPGVNGAPGGAVYTTTIGDGAASSFTVTHSLSSRNVSVSVYRTAAPFDEVGVDVERTDIQTVTIRTFPTVPAVGEYTVMVQAAGQQATLAITMDPWHLVGAAGEPAFQNSWTNYGSTAQVLAFRKDPNGKVQIRGSIKGGVSATTVFVLPVGYRPPADLGFSIVTASGASANALYVYPNGNVNVGTVGSVTTSTYLDTVEFDTDTVLQTASVAAQPLDGWHVVGAAGEPAFAAGFTASEEVAFRKYPDGTVRLRGFCGKAGGGVAFTLPAGYRPPVARRFAVSSGTSTGAITFARVYVLPDGSVTCDASYGTNAAGAPQNFDLASVEFDTETVNAYTSGVLGPPIVTALPTNPIDGQECYFLADATAGVMWHLRYRAGSASAYKWECVGGPPLISWVDTNETLVTLATWSDLATIHRITIPLAGDYEVAGQIYNISNTTAAAQLYCGAAVGAGVPGTRTAARLMTIPAQTPQASTLNFSTDMVGLAAGADLRMKHYTTVATASFSTRRLSAKPIRVG